MFHRLLPFAAILSGLLCLVTLLVWLRSGLYLQSLEYTTAAGKTYEISSGYSGMRDGLHIGTMTSSLVGPTRAHWSLERQPLPEPPAQDSQVLGYPPRWSFLGFKYCQATWRFRLTPRSNVYTSDPELAGIGGSHTIHRSFLVVPYWAATLATALLPALWFYRRQRKPSQPEM